MLWNCGAGEYSWESLGQQEDKTSQSKGKSTLNIYGKDWCWSWSSSILVIYCKQLNHSKSPWCWERLRPKGDEVIRGWDGWMASLMACWHHRHNLGKLGEMVSEGRPGMSKSIGSHGHDCTTEQQQILHCINVPPVLYALICQWIDFFHILAIVNSAAMSNRVHVYFRMVFSGYKSICGIAGRIPRFIF